jgi:hypothetical protein
MQELRGSLVKSRFSQPARRSFAHVCCADNVNHGNKPLKQHLELEDVDVVIIVAGIGLVHRQRPVQSFVQVDSEVFGRVTARAAKLWEIASSL